MRKLPGLLLAVCWLVTMQPVFAAPTLIVAGDSFCPYNCAVDAARRGYLVDLVARILGPRYVIDYRVEPWSRAVQQVESGAYQILLATSAVTGRRILLSEPLGVDRTCFFVRRESSFTYRQIKDLERLRVGVVQDYIYDNQGPLDQLLAAYRRNDDARLEVSHGADALASSYRKLVAGRMDVIIDNQNVGQHTIARLGLDKAVREAGCATHYLGTLHIGVAPTTADAAALVGTINRGVAQLRERGELQSLLAPYRVSDWQPLLPAEPRRR